MCIRDRLQAAGLPFRRECPLAPGCRIDFLAGGVGIEVKRGRPAAKPLREQVTRYARCPEVEALLVVVEGKAFLPARVGGKPCRVLSLSRNWGCLLYTSTSRDAGYVGGYMVKHMIQDQEKQMSGR